MPLRRLALLEAGIGLEGRHDGSSHSQNNRLAPLVFQPINPHMGGAGILVSTATPPWWIVKHFRLDKRPGGLSVV